MFTRNKDGTHCFVSAIHRMFTRFVALQRLDSTLTESSPLACYWDYQSKSVKLLTSTDIETYMRHIACEVYGFHLQRFSAHSLRVGACVLLHASGFTPSQIQWLGRWKTDAFKVYLRNVASLADQHNQALDHATAMPNFI